MARNLGVDVSHWQGNSGAPWFKIKRASKGRLKFGIAKVSQEQWEDVAWRSNIQKIEKTGLVPGGYHFLVAGNAAAQADFFFEHLGKNRIAVVDVERVPDAKGEKHPAADDPDFGDVKAFVKQWKKRAGNRPLFIYTSMGYWRSIGNPDGGSLDCPLWLAYYTIKSAPIDVINVNSVRTKVNFGGWRRADIVQCGPFKVGNTKYDGDVSDHSVEELEAFAGIKPTPPPPPPTVPVTERPNYRLAYNAKLDAAIAQIRNSAPASGGPALMAGNADAIDDAVQALEDLRLSDPGT